MNLIKLFVVTNIVVFNLILSLTSVGQYDINTQYMDTLSIRVSSSFTPEDFIEMTKKDTSFLRAFRNLRGFEHSAKTKVVILDKSNDSKASLLRSSHVKQGPNKGFVNIDEELVSGRYYNRKGEHKYYTTEMFDKVFFPSDSFPIYNQVGVYNQKKPIERSRIEKHYEQLKTFMFSPGLGVDGVPLIGDKLNIMESPMKELYNFEVKEVTLFDSIPCYEFGITKKSTTDIDDISIDYIYTYYDRRTMQIIQRKYHLFDQTLLFDFDIYMNITLELYKDEYVPKKIVYSGEWDIPFNRPERIQFTMLCEY